MRKLKSIFRLTALIVTIGVCLPPLWAEDTPKIDINTASAEELAHLKGIGQKKAAAIVEFRETNGSFLLPEDLVKVPGIGPKTFEANKDRITVERE